MSHSTNQDLRTLSEALATDNIDSLRSLLRNVPPGDSARLLTRLDSADQRHLLDLLPSDEAAGLLMELPVPQAAQLP